MRILFLTFLFASLLVSCNKEPGEGGTSTIKGKLYKIETNALGQVLAEYYEADGEVYIIYGTEDQTYDDKFDTSHDGSFEFNNLLPGSYTVFAYTECTTCEGQQDTTVMYTAEITDKHEVIDIGDLVVYK